MESYGVLSVLPPALSIVLAMYTRNIIFSLAIGSFSGALILANFNPFAAFPELLENHAFVQISSGSNAQVLIVMLSIGGFIHMLDKSGGSRAFASVMVKFISNPVKAQLAASATGLSVFFTDSGNALIVGPLFKPVFRQLQICREKLAYIVDTTASPVSILVPFIGWGVYAMGLIEGEFLEIGRLESSFDAFVAAIPFQFYSLFAIIMVPLVAISGYEFGPMARAELRAQAGNDIIDDSGSEVSEDMSHPKAKAIFVWLPLLVMVGVLFYLLVPLGFPLNSVPSLAFRGALSSAYFFSAISLISLMMIYGVKSFKESMTIYFSGVSKMTSVLIILVLAWSLSAIGKNLGTPEYIISLAEGNFAPFLVPMVAFLFGAVMSFATGSSWGTYAIMMPLIIAVANALGAPMHVCIGAVLSGGMFGDHCSPISDTTILSASGAGCSQFDHVKTQLPYELLNGSVCVVSYIVAGLTGNHWIFVPGMILIGLGLFAMNKFAGTKIPKIVS